MRKTTKKIALAMSLGLLVGGTGLAQASGYEGYERYERCCEYSSSSAYERSSGYEGYERSSGYEGYEYSSGHDAYEYGRMPTTASVASVSVPVVRSYERAERRAERAERRSGRDYR